VLGSDGRATIIAGPGHALLGVCGIAVPGEIRPYDFTLEQRSANTGRALVHFVCNGPDNVVEFDSTFPATPNRIIASHCTALRGASTLGVDPIKMRLDAPNPAQDYIFMPFDQYYWPHRFTATLVAGSHTQLGRVDVHARSKLRGATLRLSPAGATYVRHRRTSTRAQLVLSERNCHGGGCNGASDRISLTLG
jgi:hypothetical protein